MQSNNSIPDIEYPIIIPGTNGNDITIHSVSRKPYTMVFFIYFFTLILASNYYNLIEICSFPSDL